MTKQMKREHFRELHMDCLCVSDIGTRKGRETILVNLLAFAVVFYWDLCAVILIAANVCPI